MALRDAGMSRLRPAAVLLCVVPGLACAGGPTPVSVGDLSPPALARLGIEGPWKLVWHDEFSGTSIDSLRWTHLVRPGSNGERQYYVDHPGSSFVTGGALHLVAREGAFGLLGVTRAYTSAQLITREKGDWTYGRFEVRARVPEGQGLWPTIWLMPTEAYYGEWATSGEVDIAEFRGREPGKVYGTLHFGGRPPRNAYSSGSFELPRGGSFADAPHVFTLIWEPGAFHWFVDGHHYRTLASWKSRGHEFPAPFDRDFFFRVSLAVGGPFPGQPDDTTEFPSELVVDYVRIYQR